MIELTYALNTMFFLISGAMVMWMAAGFTALEAGSVRTKNVTEILTKNVALFAAASIAFLFLGYRIMYGWNEPGTHSMYADFFFQMVFVATAMSVVSGAVAERKKLWSFLIFAVIFSAIIYPLEGSWTWGGGFLSQLGFFDFAGSGIVHMAGAAAALASVIMIGAREGKYDENGKPKNIPGSNMPLVAIGTLILWLGWFFFNGGSQLAFSTIADANALGKIFVNTNMAAAGGLLGAMIVSKLWTKKVILNVTLNGALAGLVVITADPYSPSPEIAVLYGALGGILIPLSMTLLEKWGIDDPVGAISVHGTAGILGLLLVPIFNPDATILIQVLGIGVIGGFVFTTSLAVWWLLHKTIGIRVGKEEELVGSDMYEGTGNAYPEFIGMQKSELRE
jgi:Amt family ammonium transporter|tara:strand:+ start:50 stop:1228 length:1179 start_codon:yes stop_codon:yes gene_type:complete